MYVKAGKPGWAAIIPIYNWWVWVEIIGRPRWWFWVYLAAVLLAWIPLVGFILAIVIFVIYLMGCLDMAKCFGRGTGTGIGLWLVPFVFAPILGFGDAQYVGSPPRGPRVRRAAAARGAAATPPLRRRRRRPFAAPPAPPAPPAAPVTPTQAATPSAPVTPPVTPAEARRPDGHERRRRGARGAGRTGGSAGPAGRLAAAAAAARLRRDAQHRPAGRAGAAPQPRPFRFLRSPTLPRHLDRWPVARWVRRG